MSEILMPRLSDTMEEGVVSSWHKQPGDEITAGDALVDIETDKALMEYEAYENGVLGEILVAEGESARIGTPIAVLVTEDAEYAEPATAEGRDGTAGADGDAVQAAPDPDTAHVTRNGAGSRPPSSPLARRIARENGVDLAGLSGSGP